MALFTIPRYAIRRVLIFLAVVMGTFAAILIQGLNSTGSGAVSYYTLMVILGIWQICGIGWTLLALVKGRTLVRQFCFKMFTLQGLPHNHDKVALTMLGVFCLGTMVFAILEVISEAACLDYLNAHQDCINSTAADSLATRKHVGNISFLVTKLIFIALQIVFLLTNKGTSIEGNKSALVSTMRMYLISIMGVYLTNFLFTFFREVREKLNHTVKADSSSDDHSEPIRCYTATEWQSGLREATEYFFPFELEFYLAAIGLIIHTSVSSGDQELAEDVNNLEIAIMDEESIDNSDNQPLHSLDIPPSPLSWPYLAVVILSVVMSFMLTMFTAAHTYYEGDEATEDSMALAYYIMSMVHHLITAVLTTAALYMVRKVYDKQVSVDVGAGSLALLITMCVYSVYLFMQIFPATSATMTLPFLTSMHNKSLSNIPRRFATYLRAGSIMKVFSSLFELIQVISQTHLLLLISSHHFVKAYAKTNTKVLRTILIVLAVCNFVYWLDSSFIEFKIVQNSVLGNATYGPNFWTGVSTLVWPITLYYRYESGHTLLGVALDKICLH